MFKLCNNYLLEKFSIIISLNNLDIWFSLIICKDSFSSLLEARLTSTWLPKFSKNTACLLWKKWLINFFFFRCWGIIIIDLFKLLFLIVIQNLSRKYWAILKLENNFHHLFDVIWKPIRDELTSLFHEVDIEIWYFLSAQNGWYLVEEVCVCLSENFKWVLWKHIAYQVQINLLN